MWGWSTKLCHLKKIQIVKILIPNKMTKLVKMCLWKIWKQHPILCLNLWLLCKSFKIKSLKYVPKRKIYKPKSNLRIKLSKLSLIQLKKTIFLQKIGSNWIIWQKECNKFLNLKWLTQWVLTMKLRFRRFRQCLRRSELQAKVQLYTQIMCFRVRQERVSTRLCRVYTSKRVKLVLWVTLLPKFSKYSSLV